MPANNKTVLVLRPTSTANVGNQHTRKEMNMNHMLSQGLMKIDNKQENNTRFESLVDIHEDLQQRFITKVLAQLNDKDALQLTDRIKKIETLKQQISEHTKSIETRDLHQYAFSLKEAAMLAMKLCKAYKVYNNMKSINYNAETRMIELNGEELYFFGEAKHQPKASEASLAQEKHTCKTCESHNVAMLSELHQAELSNPTYAPPRKKFAFFAAFLACSFLGVTWILSGNGETPYLYLLVGLACLAYSAYAFHYNYMKFPAARKHWENAFSCNDCGSISLTKS